MGYEDVMFFRAVQSDVLRISQCHFHALLELDLSTPTIGTN